jgi:hypothetical protein
VFLNTKPKISSIGKVLFSQLVFFNLFIKNIFQLTQKTIFSFKTIFKYLYQLLINESIN